MTAIRLIPYFACLLITIAANASAETKVTSMPTPFEGLRAKTITDAGGIVHLIANKTGNIYYSRLAAGKEEFSDPIQVNSVPGSAAIGEIAIGKDGQVHVLFHGNIHYIKNQIKDQDRKLQGSDIKYTFYTRLNAAKDGFEEQRNVSGDVWGFDAGCAIAADSKGNVYTFVNGTRKKGNETVRQIFKRVSNDNGDTFSEPEPAGLGKGVCACCHLKATVNNLGHVMFVYRVAEERVDRDSYIMLSTDSGKTFEPSRLDKWALNACPGTVYSFAQIPGSDGTMVSWRNKQEIYLRVAGSGKVISPPGKDLKRRVAALSSNSKGEILVAWAEGMNFNKPHHLRWQLYDKEGNALDKMGLKKGAFKRWGNPAVYARENGDFVVLH